MNKYEVFYKTEYGGTEYMECPTNNKEEVEKFVKQKLKVQLDNKEEEYNKKWKK